MFQGCVFKATLPSINYKLEETLQALYNIYEYMYSSAFYRKCQCYSVNRKRLKSLLFCTHSVISTANNGSVVFEASCVQAHVHVHILQDTCMYAIHMYVHTAKICCICQKA